MAIFDTTVAELLARIAQMDEIIEQRNQICSRYFQKIERLEGENKSLTAENQRLRADGERLDWIDSECADLRCEVHQYTDDSDTYYQVVTHHMTAPKERIVGQGKDVRSAIDDANGKRG